MKILKKINKGLVLTIIVIVALVIYLVGVEKQREADKDDIIKACEEFIDFTDKYSVIPEDVLKLGEVFSQDKLNEYIQKMKNELPEYMIENDEAVGIEAQILQTNLENAYSTESNTEQENTEQTGQSNGNIINSIKTKMEREITKISSYEYDGNQVTVTFNSTTTLTTNYLNNGETQENQSSFNGYEEQIILQKIDSKWKVVYSDLQNDDYTNLVIY